MRLEGKVALITGADGPVAAAQVFLASDEAGYITGQVLFVDGGMSLVAYARRLRGEMP